MTSVVMKVVLVSLMKVIIKLFYLLNLVLRLYLVINNRIQKNFCRSLCVLQDVDGEHRV